MTLDKFIKAHNEPKPIKPVRRKVVKCYPPTAINGMYVRLVKLSCGHEQEMARSDYSRTGRTVVCFRCTEPRLDGASKATLAAHAGIPQLPPGLK